LAKLSKVKLTKPISITDNTYDVSPVTANVSQLKSLSIESASSSDSQISTGEMNISSDISILWGIE